MHHINAPLELLLHLIACFIPGSNRRKAVRNNLRAYLLKKYTPRLIRLHQTPRRKKRLARNLITEQMCNGKRCIVVGSAPGACLPKQQSGDVVMGANGGAAIARKSGRDVDIFCTVASLFFDGISRKDRATLKSLGGVSSRVAYVHVQRQEPSPDLSNFGIAVQNSHYLTKKQKLQIIESACGLPLRVSTGIFAVCLAVASKAACVEVAGFSFSDGHEGMPWDNARRDHIAEDDACLRGIQITNPDIKLTIHQPTVQ